MIARSKGKCHLALLDIAQFSEGNFSEGCAILYSHWPGSEDLFPTNLSGSIHCLGFGLIP